MQTYFEVKVKYLLIDQTGHEKKKTSTFLFDAVSFTDAETRIFEQMNEITNGEFQVVNIKRSNITDVISIVEGEFFFKAKISLVTIDEEAGKEKKINQYILVMADDIDQAHSNLAEGLSYMLIPYTVTGMNLSPIEEVFPYDLEKGVAKMKDPDVTEPCFEGDTEEK